MRQVLGLEPRTQIRSERYGLFGRKTRETELTAYTWTIDGVRIADWIGHHRQSDDPVIPTEETAWLAGDADDARDRIARLLGQAPPDFGARTALLSCPVCGGPGCGAFTAEIGFDAETIVVWKAIGYDGGSTEQPPYLFEPALALRFDRSQYVNLLTSVLDTLEGPRPLTDR